MVYSDGSYRSTRGNVINGAFVALTSAEQSSNAVLADAQEYDHAGTNYGSILLAGPSSGTTTSNLIGGCCSPTTVAYETDTDLSQSSTDGAYAVIKSLPSIGTNETFSFRWVFGGNTYTALTSSTFLNEIVAAVDGSLLAPKSKPAPALRQTYNLSFDQSQYGSDTLSDPDGQLRATLDQVMSKYGSLVK